MRARDHEKQEGSRGACHFPVCLTHSVCHPMYSQQRASCNEDINNKLKVKLIKLFDPWLSFPLPGAAPSRQFACFAVRNISVQGDQRRHKCDKFQSCRSIENSHPPTRAFLGTFSQEGGRSTLFLVIN